MMAGCSRVEAITSIEAAAVTSSIEPRAEPPPAGGTRRACRAASAIARLFSLNMLSKSSSVAEEGPASSVELSAITCKTS